MSKPPDNPADPFKKALSEATRAMAGEAELNVAFSVDPPGMSAGTMRLPQVTRRMTRDEVLLARGTADALLSATEFIGEEPFVVLNSDNYYPVAVLRALREEGAPALPAFDREGLVRGGNIDRARIASFALLVIRPDGTLARVAEKPDAATMEALGPDTPVSMNCWAFPPEILEACRSIEPSQRGELEIPNAVQYAIDHLGMEFRTVPTDEGVLDLSSRGDIEAVKARLASVRVDL